MKIKSLEYQRGIKDAMPLAISFIPVGLIFGTLASQYNLAPFTAYLMTALNYAGGSEFAVLSLWSISPPLLLVALSTLFINSRHIVMGATLAPYIKEPLHRVFFIYFFMCDEAWALAIQDCQRRDKFSFSYYIALALTLWLAWSISALVGALIGYKLGDLSAFGLTIALPTIFMCLLKSMIPNEIKKIIPVIIAAISSALLSLIIPASYTVAVGGIAGIISAYIIEVYNDKHVS